MKKIVGSVVLLVTAVVLTACGGGGGGGAAFLPPTAGGPAAPQNVSAAQGPGVQKITIGWGAVSGATSYNLYWSNSALVSKTSGTLISNITSSFTHTHLNAGTYYYVVTAVNANGESRESATASASVNLVSFVTSTTGNSNLSTWADAVSAGTLTGTAAGDAVCQARAGAANLTGTYKAWISSSSDDAYCRIHNLSGKKSAKCGQGTLPAAAGPWVRTDGAPFAPGIATMTGPAGIVYTPLNYDESGAFFPYGGQFTATNTNSDGTGNFMGIWNACSDWTNGTDATLTVAGVSGGYIFSTSYSWTAGYGFTCTQNHPLVCMQTGTGPQLSIIPAVGKKAFVTSTTQNGNLGGLAGADAICQIRATAAGLANAANFKAWLSDGATNAVSRLTGNGPWVRLDGIKVADNKTDLTDGNIFTSISLDEFGNSAGNYLVWTGSDALGIKMANTCTNWTSASTGVNGQAGYAAAAGFDSWSKWSSFACNNALSLYCFED